MNWELLLLCLPILGFVWPWQAVDPETQIPVAQYSEPVGPFAPVQDANGEEFGPFAPVAQVISKAYKDSTALMTRTSTPAIPQGDGCAWYSRLNPLSQCNTITASATSSVASSVSGIGDFLQSTMIKVAVMVVLAVILVSYLQAKGGQLAKA